jgi:hypothetical protein
MVPIQYPIIPASSKAKSESRFFIWEVNEEVVREGGGNQPACGQPHTQVMDSVYTGLPAPSRMVTV